MTGKNIYDDDFVANILVQDAKMLSSQTLKRSALAPKPNTRFLRNIIREADGHNAALKRKEKQESRYRNRKFDRENRHDDGSTTHRSGRLTPPPGYEDELEGHRRSKRRKLDDKRSLARSGKHAEYDSGQETRGAGSRSRNRRKSFEYDYRRRSRSPQSSRRHKKHESWRRSSGKDGLKIERDVNEDSERDNHVHRPTGCSSLSDRTKSALERKHQSLNHNVPAQGLTTTETTTEAHCSPSLTSDLSSDPLEELIGPKPPSPSPKVRGRGRRTLRNSKTIDKHFESGYDPMADASPDSHKDEDEWEQALEAMRDRLKWQQVGSQRLRDAGFSEDEIKKSEKRKIVPDEEGDVDDVRWKKKGEDREWDRGKVLEGDNVKLKPEWSR